MLNLFLILLILILIIPRPLSETMKKLLPLWGSIVVIALIVFVVQRIEERKNSPNVVITALNEKNEAADGSEIWLMRVTVNGVSHRPSDYFGNSWIEKEDALVWRAYEQKEEMPDTISARFEPGTNVELTFQANKWRGKAQIIYENQNELLDFYLDTDNGKEIKAVKINISPTATGGGKLVFLVSVFIFLILLNFIYYIGYYLVKGHWPQKLIVLRERELWLDGLKIISSIMVILIHSSGNLYKVSFINNSRLWIKVLFLNGVSRFAVPCFLMITGALLLGKSYDFGKKLIPKIIHILIPLCIWSFVYIVARKLLWNGSENLLYEILKIPFKNQDGALWYGYQLIWIYLGMPFWQILYQQLNERMRWYFVLFSLGIPGILTMLGELSFLNVPEYIPFTSINPVICYVGMIFLGRLWYEKIMVSKEQKIFLSGIILTCIGLSIMLLSSFYVSTQMEQAAHTFFSEVRIPAVLYSSGIFLICGSVRNIVQQVPQIIKNLIISLSSVSLGVYFSHCLAVWIFPSMTIGGIWIWKDSGSIIQLLICVGIYYGMAVILCLLLSRLPWLKRLVT